VSGNINPFLLGNAHPLMPLIEGDDDTELLDASTNEIRAYMECELKESVDLLLASKEEEVEYIPQGSKMI
jgi:hypothetical protein